MVNKRPIIIIDDDQDDREVMVHALESIGIAYPVRLFENTREAMGYLQTDGQPLLIISDINMPGENGLEFKRRIDLDPVLQKRSIPFVFISTVIQPAMVAAAYLEFTVQGFFQKPVTLDQYKTMLRRIIDYWEICKHPNI